jgi:phosphatidylserine/phosphatidylglycerophosphate/cardiolipin synthase-like enzyme
MIKLQGTSSVFAAVGHARSIVATAYLLEPGRMLRALESAARRGARVVVRVQGRPLQDQKGEMRRVNEKAVRELCRAGADAKLVDSAANEPVMHMKAVVCDGVAYLDDRNFTSSGDETVLRDDTRADVDAVLAAAQQKKHAALRSFWTTKADAIAAENRLLQSASGAKSVDIETESFSSDGAAYIQLKRLVASGVRCRLIVSKRALNANGQHAVALLERAGVQVRAAGFNGKVAIVDESRAWFGSANSTSPYYNPDQTDWAVRTNSKRLTSALETRFEAHWRASKPLNLSS